MPGHSFKVVTIHEDLGLVDVCWDNNAARIVTCRLPLDDQGQIAEDPAFADGIINQCALMLRQWDQIALLDKQDIRKCLSREYNVTEARIMKNIPQSENKIQSSIGAFNLKDHV